MRRLVLTTVLLLVSASWGWAQTPDDWQKAGEDAFRKLQFAESVASFDKVLAAVPTYAPQHWQRGISLYYAGRFADCRKQFESHQSVNPEDVENSVWHMLCVSRIEGFAAARAKLLPVKADPRPVMATVLEVFAGRQNISRLLQVGQQTNSMFFAFLYAGLYEETAGKRQSSRSYFREAARLAPPHYMGDVARVHWQALEQNRLP